MRCVIVPAFRSAELHRHEADAGFHQPARQHQLAADAEWLAVARILILAIELGHGLRLVVERERFARCGRTDQLICLAVEIAHRIEFGRVRFHGAEVIFHGFARGLRGVRSVLR